jgi:hypothetical protein
MERRINNRYEEGKYITILSIRMKITGQSKRKYN